MDAKPDLSPREQEVLILLLDGVIPKEITHTLNISYNTVLSHQKKIYCKLGVQNVNELLTKYSAETTNKNITYPARGIAAVVTRWETFIDELGSSVSITTQIEKIKRQYFTCYSIFGTLSTDHHAHTGVLAYPDSSTHESMKTMSSFSFTVLGDGNTYDVMITTSDTRIKGGLNHYRESFTTVKGKISTFNVNISDMVQSPYFGKQVPFNQQNIECLQFQAFSTGEFNLKVWNIRLYQ
jgi:DNA-binding CsgD family transcriptional regulator